MVLVLPLYAARMAFAPLHTAALEAFRVTLGKTLTLAATDRLAAVREATPSSATRLALDSYHSKFGHVSVSLS